MDEHAFPPTGFAVARLGRSLHNVKTLMQLPHIPISLANAKINVKFALKLPNMVRMYESVKNACGSLQMSLECCD